MASANSLFWMISFLTEPQAANLSRVVKVSDSASEGVFLSKEIGTI